MAKDSGEQNSRQFLEALQGISVEHYTYDLPEERIAKFPLAERDASRLLVYRDGTITERPFRDAPALFGGRETLVFNNTRVIHARLLFRKSTGALIEIFCLEPSSPVDYATNFAATGACEWRCMVGNLRKWKEGTVVCDFESEGRQYRLEANKIGMEGNDVLVSFSWDAPLSFSEVLEHCGRIPIPPYLNRESEASDDVRYQTVYSKNDGSVAAPTAGLHFTPSVIDTLRGRGVDIEELTLHVGAGTFKPVKAPTIGGHDMHTEHIVVPRRVVERLREHPDEVVAVGTTSVRTLESLYWMGVKRLLGREDFSEVGQWEAYTLPASYSLPEAMAALLDWFDAAGTDLLKARTTIIILPGYRYRVISAMFTNFHQPRSTLLLLVAAAIGDDWQRVYRYALDHGFRFLSYGDSSFLKIRNR